MFGELHRRMTILASPTSVFRDAATDATNDDFKIIQRIRPLAVSKYSKARCMADADKDLVLQSQNGSAAAFETLIRNHQTMVHALTFRMTGSSADAEDLAQETFIRAYEQINHFNGGAKFSTWLYIIAASTKAVNWPMRGLFATGAFLILWALVAILSRVTLRANRA